MSTNLFTITHAGAYRLVGPDVGQLTEHLADVFGIEPGVELARVLAAEAPAFNHAALRYWVRIELAEIAHQPVDNVLIALEQRLHRLLQAQAPRYGRDIVISSSRAQRSNFPMPCWQYTTECLPRGKSGAGRQGPGAGVHPPSAKDSAHKEDRA